MTVASAVRAGGGRSPIVQSVHHVRAEVRERACLSVRVRPSVRPPVFCPVAAPERVSVQTAPSPPYRLSALAGSLARPIAVSLTGCGGDRDRSPARLLCIAHFSHSPVQSH